MDTEVQHSDSPAAAPAESAPIPERQAREIARRRTFAIISHPDAGKTTLTEKLLLYGGAIHLAGSVKARRATRHATSDWMKLEQERGISVTSSVLQFEFEGYQLNLLDTPGHEDFSADTYRTLVAADSAIMLLDNRRGVEERTRQLFDVCKMRRTPIFTLVNKCDRHGEDPLKLIQDVENDLGIDCFAATWPVFDNDVFVGVYDRLKREVHLFERTGDRGASRAEDTIVSIDDPALIDAMGESAFDRLLAATNTDAAGFLEPLLPRLRERHLFRMARVLGTGGAARAIIVALVNEGVTVVLAGRDVAKARALLEELDPGGEHHAVALDHFAEPTDFAFDDREGCLDLIVNASPLGMAGQPDLRFELSHAPPGSIVYDIVTHPLDTPLLKAAREAGFETLDGLNMLIGQAAIAFERFFGQSPPRADGDSELRVLLMP